MTDNTERPSLAEFLNGTRVEFFSLTGAARVATFIKGRFKIGRLVISIKGKPGSGVNIQNSETEATNFYNNLDVKAPQ